jgi:hypothetical protein
MFVGKKIAAKLKFKCTKKVLAEELRAVRAKPSSREDGSDSPTKHNLGLL